MLILYSAKIWALTVEKLISPPTDFWLIFSVRFNNSFSPLWAWSRSYHQKCGMTANGTHTTHELTPNINLTGLLKTLSACTDCLTTYLKLLASEGVTFGFHVVKRRHFFIAKGFFKSSNALIVVI
mgnify:CR=1